jgi:hypothetical protein
MQQQAAPPGSLSNMGKRTSSPVVAGAALLGRYQVVTAGYAAHAWREGGARLMIA